jgi:hypothetical protein
MSRFQLGGQGSPIPNIALPDPNLSSDLPVQSLELVDGVPFDKADWVALGYTHYEVWCIGGAGGLGAMPGYPVFPTIFTTEAMPADVWAASMAAQAAYDAQLQPPWDFDAVDWRFSYIEPGNPNYPVGGVPGVDYGWPHSHRQWIEHNNPGHLGNVTTFLTPFTAESGGAFGGGGGGGGLHVMSGELADLPNSVPVTVGKAGVNADPGQIMVNGAYISPMPPPGYGGVLGWANRYAGTPNPTFLPPGLGEDGETSSFGNICRASGGKGGHPSVVWAGGLLVVDGAGGEGGAGDRDTPGGGGLGSTSGSNGMDGSWDGTIGKGGGGGRGGTYTPPSAGAGFGGALPGV